MEPQYSARPPRRWYGVLIIVVAGWAVYANSLSGPFIFDDTDSIVENTHIRQLWPVGKVLSAPAKSSVSGRPVISLTLAANYALGGLDVWGYHVFNVLAHVATALVLLGLLRGSMIRIGTSEARAFWFAMSAALIWVVHPLCTDALNQIIYRTEVLMSLFYLLTMYCALRGADSAGKSKTWYTGAVLACALGMGCKENMVSAPIAALLFDRVFMAGSLRNALRVRWPLYTGLAAAWLVLAAVRTTRPGAGFDFAHLPLLSYLATQCGVLLHYLRLSFWPHPLVLEYSGWPMAANFAEAWAATAFVATFAITVLMTWRSRPELSFLWIVGFFILAPTSLIPNAGEVVAEHRMYLPLVAVIVTALALAYSVLRRISDQFRLDPSSAAAIRFVTITVVVASLGWTTVARNQVYDDPLSVWMDVVEKQPEGHRGYGGVASALREQGKGEEAITWYKKVLEIDPDDLEANINIGGLLQQNGRHAEAIAYFEKVLALDPQYAKAHSNIGLSFLAQGLSDAAITHFRKAIELRPDLARAHVSLGIALAQAGSMEEAKSHFLEALKTKPDFAEIAHNLVGKIYLAQGQFPEAIDHFEKALRIRPNLADAQAGLEQAKLRMAQAE